MPWPRRRARRPSRSPPPSALAARFGKGGNALRIGTIVYGAWHCVVGTFTLGLTAGIAPTAIVMAALVEMTAGVLLIVFMVQKDGVAWFSRPRR
jgi:hypothetical protein